MTNLGVISAKTRIQKVNTEPNMNKKWDAELYRQTATQQTKLALSILKEMTFKGDERVLDIGCGDGRITAYIATELVPKGTVLGIDASPEMIKLSQETFPQNIYSNLAFQNIPAEALNLPKQFDVIISFNALHWVKEQVLALKNIYNALVPHGRVFILIHPRVEHVWGPPERISASKKWEKYFKNFLQPHQFYDVDGYEILVRQSGLTIDSIKIKSHMLQLPTLTDYINILKSFSPYPDQVPAELREAFLKDVAADFEKFSTRDEEGDLLLPLRRIEVVAHRD